MDTPWCAYFRAFRNVHQIGAIPVFTVMIAARASALAKTTSATTNPAVSTWRLLRPCCLTSDTPTTMAHSQLITERGLIGPSVIGWTVTISDWLSANFDVGYGKS